MKYLLNLVTIFIFNIRFKNKLTVGFNLDFKNQGEINAKNSYFAAIDNLTVKIIQPKKSYLFNSGKIVLKSNSRIHKGGRLHNTGEFNLGESSYINPNCLIICKEKIEIGDNCAIGWNVTFMDNELHSFNNKIKESSSIQIGNKVWIGSNCTILKGSKIPNGCVIASNSLVNNSFTEENCLIGGTPAKIIKQNITWEL